MSNASSPPCGPASACPAWFLELLGLTALPATGEEVRLQGQTFVLEDGLLRQKNQLSASQSQTGDMFAYKWGRVDTYESPAAQDHVKQWVVERYGELASAAYWASQPAGARILDAGCGSGYTALPIFGNNLKHLHYLGVDVSRAVDVGVQRFAAAGVPGAFMQADMLSLPLPTASFDFILADGTLHHTDSTRNAILALTPLLRPGGQFAFYVYAKKSPIREFTDDYVRAQLQDLSPEEAWLALGSLTRFGIMLGELNLTVEVPEAVSLLGIPAGRHDLQRLFYWHVCKTFYRPEYSFEEMNHANFDWYSPRNAHRQTPDEVRAWCAEAGLEIVSLTVMPSGITVVARRV